MAITPGFEHDIFVSYAHADNFAPLGKEGWVVQFIDGLDPVLRQRLGGDGKALRIFFDREATGANYQLPELLTAVKKSALLLAVGSPSYVASDWTRQELEAFVAQTTDLSRIFLIEFLPLNSDERYPVSLKNHIRLAFWKPAKPRRTPMPLSPSSDTGEFPQLIHGLAIDIRAKLIALRNRPGHHGQPLLTAGSASKHVVPKNRETAVAPPVGYVVGRAEEIRLVEQFVKGDSASILNIYGTGGIGKTTLCEKLIGWCKSAEVPFAIADLDKLPMGLTEIGILSRLKEGLESDDNLSDAREAFQDFDLCALEHSQLRDAVDRNGGINKIFDAYGDPRCSPLAHRAFAHQDHLTRYFDRVPGTMTSAFARGITAALAGGQDVAKRRLVLFLDAYEKLDPQLERWLWRELIANLPTTARAIMLGRRNIRTTASWVNDNCMFRAHELKELSECEAKAYLKHYGATRDATLNRIYSVTKGFPLLLVLARQLKEERSSWERSCRISDAATFPDFLPNCWSAFWKNQASRT